MSNAKGMYMRDVVRTAGLDGDGSGLGDSTVIISECQTNRGTCRHNAGSDIRTMTARWNKQTSRDVGGPREGGACNTCILLEGSGSRNTTRGDTVCTHEIALITDIERKLTPKDEEKVSWVKMGELN